MKIQKLTNIYFKRICNIKQQIQRNGSDDVGGLRRLPDVVLKCLVFLQAVPEYIPYACDNTKYYTPILYIAYHYESPQRVYSFNHLNYVFYVNFYKI